MTGEIAIKEKRAFAAVILVGIGLLVWVAFGTRYYYSMNGRDEFFRVDGWTGTRQFWRCEERPTGASIVTASSPTSASAPHDKGRVSLPLSASELDRLNKTRQDHHLPRVDGWGHELVRTCRWVNG